jgi:acetoin utilization deacetylase AcuC-like enzyme
MVNFMEMLKIAWTHDYCHDLPKGHRFPMVKYELIPQQLLHEGTISADNIFAPGPLPEDEIILTHDPKYWSKLKELKLSRSEERRTGFPLSEQLVHRETVIAQGTIDCAHYALENGIAMNVAGGTHHAYTDRGEGFCLLNDIALGANHLLRHQLVQQVLVVDLDVHQGNGTAQIFRNEGRVFTFSMHGEKNYPYFKEESDLDIPLPDGTDDKSYLKALKMHLPEVMDRSQPDFVFFQSGVDVLYTDKLGRLGLSIHGCRERDRFVLQLCKDTGIPVVVVMGGGYSEDIKLIIEAHANTFRLAEEIFF